MKITKLVWLFPILFLSSRLLAQQTAFTVKVTGRGEPVFLLPGFTCTADVWQETVAAISTNHECHAFTFAGFGGVPPIGLPWLPTIKTQLIEYIKNKNLHHVTIIGHSLGGTLGMWLVTAEPALFKKLIAVDALPCTGALLMPNFKASQMVYDNPFSKQQLAMDSAHFHQMARQMASGMSLNQTKHDQLVDWMMKADRKTYVYGYVDLLKLDLREELANTTVPVVILAATYPNRQQVETTWNQQLARLKEKHIYYADQSAHFIMYDQPAWFIARIRENLQ
ncbi:alpha/beta fold hydrolase [Spirosoma linguale]|uniref:Alpha/beta hydrolase fold n=1 Tax=Spirosoma linguale (strain ATCC 33905 / DSM 74 / LMG 10896 / Claus 1) TaxID=504472 RepID=D2QCV6_SPILD|nr:putative alpha/beta hydrolase fold precursor [Spirosoma linguale DSM 74]